MNKKQNSKDSGKILDPYKLTQLSNARQLQNQYKTSVNNEICRYGGGQIFGELEFLNKGMSCTTVVCESQHGELICVKLNEFQKKVKSNDAGYKALLFNADNKS